MSEIATPAERDSTGSDSKPTTSHLRLVPEPSPRAEEKSVALQRQVGEALDIDLQWFLLSGDAAMGARGTLAGVVSQIERGSVGGTGNLDDAGCYSHPYTDLQIGCNGTNVGIGDVERHRWLTAAWRELSPEMQTVLVIRYSAPRAELRSDSGYGALDRFIPVADGSSAAAAARAATGLVGGEGAVERHQGDAERRSRQARRTGVEGFLGDLAALCFALCADAAKLLVACQEPEPKLHRKDGTVVLNKDGVALVNRSLQGERRKLRAETMKLARAADAAAHRLWAEAKLAVKGVRTVLERTGVVRPPKPRSAPPATRQVQTAGVSGVDDAGFGDAVLAALLESGWQPTPRRRKLVVLEPMADSGLGTREDDHIHVQPSRSEGGAPSGGGAQWGLLGLLNAHADEAL